MASFKNILRNKMSTFTKVIPWAWNSKKKKKNLLETKAEMRSFIFTHHHHVPEGLGMFPVPWSSRRSWSLHLFLCRPMFLSPFGLYYSACFGSLFVSILCKCCSHFSLYCFISFTMFCAPVFCLTYWFFSLSGFVIPTDFKYLGYRISEYKSDLEDKLQIYNKINGAIWRYFGKQMNKETKLRIHNITAKAALKFGSEAWVLK